MHVRFSAQTLASAPEQVCMHCLTGNEHETVWSESAYPEA